MRKNAYLVLAFFLTSTTLLISQNQNKEKTIKKDNRQIQDNSIVVPENLDENINKLLQNWQIDFSESKNYCSKGVNIVYNDSVYMNRLYNLPSEMELSYNSVVLKHIEMYTNRRRDLVSYMLSLGNYYYPMFEEALDRYGLPLELKYLPVIESALNPVAVSRMGATGLWQFMLRTGQQYNLEVNSLVDERRDPYKSTDAAARFLKDLYQLYGDWNLVIAAYNCGPGNVNKAIARNGGKGDYWDIYNYLPRETRGYVPAFIAANYVMNYNDEHNICPQESAADLSDLDTIHVTNEVHFEQIASVLNIPIEDIRRYNPQFKRDIIPGNHKPYALILPVKTMYAFITNSDEIINYNKSLYLTHRKETLTNLSAETTASNNYQKTYYRIKKGDTLGAIASRNRTTVARLQQMNSMRSTRLSVGKRIVIKQTSKPVTVKELQKDNLTTASKGEVENTYHKIKKGETLSEIAIANGTTVAQLQSVNGLKSTKLVIGKSIVVKQNVLTPTLDKANAEININERPRVESELPSTLSNENIITEYLNKKKEQMKDNI
ncbi:MAG: transglycosylase SLT domain-containing protein [Candidatus Saccharimonadaceae bacterium]